MITITNVQIKTTKKGDPYKLLSLAGGQSVAMWSDDVYYEDAVVGAELNRDIEQNGKYWNLLPPGEKPKSAATQAHATSTLDQAQMSSIWWLLKKIADKLEVEYSEPTEVEQIQEKYADDDIDPESIPF